MSEHDEPKTALTETLAAHALILLPAPSQASARCLCGETVGERPSFYAARHWHAAHLADVLLAEGYTTSPAPDPAVVEERDWLLGSVRHQERMLQDVRDALDVVKDRLDEFTYDELSSPLEDRALDLSGDYYEPASPAPEAIETVEHLQARLDDQTAARRIAGGAADRFRDVLSECLGHADENPGDDVLVTELREHFGKTGPEPTRWRDFLTGARAVMDQINAMPDPWVPVDRAADEHEEGGQ